MREGTKRDLFVMFVCSLMVMIAALSGCGEKYSPEVRKYAQAGVDAIQDYLDVKISREELIDKFDQITERSNAVEDPAIIAVNATIGAQKLALMMDLDIDALKEAQEKLKGYTK